MVKMSFWCVNFVLLANIVVCDNGNADCWRALWKVHMRELKELLQKAVTEKHGDLGWIA